MAFEGFLTRIFTIGEGLKPQYPIVAVGGTRGLKGTKWHLRVPYSYFYNWQRV
ncbi:Hypothetical protein FKW44_005750 [Caligus rogercresseyi]|uniref:Uncharacterized protein n=1 Tax=Caligus rogercresseyi TaxID=217165 RepID=A0A7T8KCD5_CALRO|nr:Hypothetical protein FKW44_005750 [Caligus rogercresseyi]